MKAYRADGTVKDLSVATTAAAAAPDRAVIEFYIQAHGPRLGIVTNIPPRRVVACINHHRPDGTAVAFDPDGVRYGLESSREVRVLAERAEAGWGNLA